MKRFLFIALMLVSLTSAATQSLTSLTMLSAATTTSTSDHFQPWGVYKTFHAKGTTSAGAGAATIKIEGSDVTSTVDNEWVLVCTITLTLATTSSGDGCVTAAPWRYERARVTAISGTNASVNVYMGSESAGK